MSGSALSNLVSRARLEAAAHSPFFATLALQAPWRRSERVGVAATDGRVVYLNPEGFVSYSSEGRTAILLHETLHCALLHVPRRGPREAELWNVAADIVVNGLLRTNGVDLPDDALTDADLEERSVEEVYEVLRDHVDPDDRTVGFLGEPDLRPELADAGEDGAGGQSEQRPGPEAADGARSSAEDGSAGRLDSGPRASDHLEQAREYWEHAVATARYAASSRREPGTEAGQAVRDVAAARETPTDWRRILWRYLSDARDDYGGFDRRFVGRRPPLYLETLEGERLNVSIAVDTSGSVSDDELAMLLGEVRAILDSHEHCRGRLYYFDTDVDGPHDLDGANELPAPSGGGGTDVRPVFEAIDDNPTAGERVAVVLTDGFSDMPETPPRYPVLWAVPPGGRDSDEFPFGRVVRLLE